MRSVYLNYDDFRRPVGGAMKLPGAGFSSFECNCLLAWLNDGDWLQENYGYI